MPVNNSNDKGTKNLNGKTLQSVFDFDLIINHEFGLIKFIQENYQDPRAFNLEVLNKSDKEILSLLYSRTEENPLSIITTEENKKDIDKLYQSFYDDCKTDILHNCIIESSLLDFVKLAFSNRNNFGVNPYIAVRDKEEEEFISEFVGADVSFINKYKDTIYIKACDPFYVADYRFFIETNMYDVKGKNIYILPKFYSELYFAQSGMHYQNKIVLIGKKYGNFDKKPDEEENKDGDKKE